MLHKTEIHRAGINDQVTLDFWTDLQKLMSWLYQSMPILGPWMEARVKEMTRGWLPSKWCLSGPSQVIDPARPELRSRSWDIVKHRPLSNSDYPPPASSESGWPLIPLDRVAVVIDTKTNFNDPHTYAQQTAFNLMNDAREPQLEFLGPDIAKIILTAASSRTAESMFRAGEPVGLEVYSLSQMRSGPVSDGAERLTTWTLQRLADGTLPMERFRESVMAATDRKALGDT